MLKTPLQGDSEGFDSLTVHQLCTVSSWYGNLPFKQESAGSIPVRCTKRSDYVAQSVEHFLGGMGHRFDSCRGHMLLRETNK
jgi:hypothetical protein